MNPSLHELVFPWSNKITKLFIGNRLHFHFFFLEQWIINLTKMSPYLLQW